MGGVTFRRGLFSRAGKVLAEEYARLVGSGLHRLRVLNLSSNSIGDRGLCGRTETREAAAWTREAAAWTHRVAAWIRRVAVWTHGCSLDT